MDIGTVKIFLACRYQDLEKQVNEWIETHEIISIQYAMTENKYSALVYYLEEV